MPVRDICDERVFRRVECRGARRGKARRGQNLERGRGWDTAEGEGPGSTDKTVVAWATRRGVEYKDDIYIRSMYREVRVTSTGNVQVVA